MYQCLTSYIYNKSIFKENPPYMLKLEEIVSTQLRHKINQNDVKVSTISDISNTSLI